MRKEIPIFFTFDDNYVVPAAVAFYSLLTHAKENIFYKMYVLHKRLALPQDCIVMDIPQACSGYVLGLFQASMLINAGCKNVLLLVGDTFSKFSDMFIDNTAPVFGDAGSATLLRHNKSASTIYFNINSDGTNYDSFICKNGGFRNIPKPDSFMKKGNSSTKQRWMAGKFLNLRWKKLLQA